MKMTQNDEKLRQDVVRLFLYCMLLYKNKTQTYSENFLP